jgi:hypothetical protein
MMGVLKDTKSSSLFADGIIIASCEFYGTLETVFFGFGVGVGKLRAIPLESLYLGY